MAFGTGFKSMTMTLRIFLTLILIFHIGIFNIFPFNINDLEILTFNTVAPISGPVK